ncbi:hypothetical protein SAMN05421595_1294 [Austwickia chelonae]|nr:hypothetical protein SAMN05421595_1294 [Austwickia chelonae]
MVFSPQRTLCSFRRQCCRWPAGTLRSPHQAKGVIGNHARVIAEDFRWLGFPW